MTGEPSSSTPGWMWTQCETYLDDCRLGTIVIMSGSCGGVTKELLTVALPWILFSPELLYELSTELDDLWPLVPPL